MNRVLLVIAAATGGMGSHVAGLATGSSYASGGGGGGVVTGAAAARSACVSRTAAARDQIIVCGPLGGVAKD